MMVTHTGARKRAGMARGPQASRKGQVTAISAHLTRAVDGLRKPSAEGLTPLAALLPHSRPLHQEIPEDIIRSQSTEKSEEQPGRVVCTCNLSTWTEEGNQDFKASLV